MQQLAALFRPVSKNRSPRVVLVGRRLSSNENLGLGYLRAALKHAGISSATHYVSNGEELGRAAEAILEANPAVLGLSFMDGGSAFLNLALGELVRRRGFQGHITCGGQWATLSRDWLLARYAWLDSVVRHDGEIPLIEIVHRVESGQSVDDLASVTTRRGDGPPAGVTDDLPMEIWPEHDALPELIGFPAAHVVGSRGCWGRCHYCGPASLSTLARKEGKARGLSVAVLNQTGVGGLRQRDLTGLAGEIASLYHERGVRYFYFVDEHFLPHGEDAALSFLARFKEALDKHRLGPFGIGAMLRANWITPAMIRAFREVGMVRCFLGLEVATSAEGRLFGRRAPADKDVELLRTFAEMNIATVSNLMMLHPDSTPDHIRAGIDLLSRVPAGVFEATRMMVYHGTKLYDRIAAEGRLLGNPLRYGYTFEDPAMERFAEIFTRLRGEAFWNYSIAYRTHDAHLALALSQQVVPDRVRPSVVELLEATRRGVNELYVEGYRRGLDLALEGGGFHEATPLIREIRARADQLDVNLAELEEALLRLEARHDRSFSPMRAAAATMMSFALLGSSGCYLSETPLDGAMVDAGDRADSGRPDGGRRDADTCAPGQAEAEAEEVAAIANETEACFSGYASYTDPDPPRVVADHGSGGFPSIVVCDTDPDVIAARQQMADRVREALAARGHECVGRYVDIPGGTRTDLNSISDRVNDCEPLFDFGNQVRIVLDDAGTVARVETTPSRPELSECLEAALSGLTFPCLASFEVCPEYAIAE